MTEIISVLSLAALCGAWVVFQKWIRRVDPGQPGVEAQGGGCGSNCRRLRSRAGSAEYGHTRTNKS